MKGVDDMRREEKNELKTADGAAHVRERPVSFERKLRVTRRSDGKMIAEDVMPFGPYGLRGYLWVRTLPTGARRRGGVIHDPCGIRHPRTLREGHWQATYSDISGLTGRAGSVVQLTSACSGPSC